MKKIFQIAAYDFRRLMFNPITLAVMGILMVGCLLLGLFYKIPTAPTYSAITLGEDAREIYSNFVSDEELTISNQTVDRRNSLDNLLEKSKNQIAIIKTISPKENSNVQMSPEYEQLLNIKTEFNSIQNEIALYPFREPKYITQGDKEIRDASEHLENFISDFEKKGEFETSLFFTKENFQKLQEVSEYFVNLLNSGNSPSQIVEKLHADFDIFTKFSPAALKTDLWINSEDEVESLQEILRTAEAKKDSIDREMQTYSNSPIINEQTTEKVKNLITSYKLTCESAHFVVQSELELLLSAHFGDLDKLFGYSNIAAKEDLRQNITKAKFFLEDKNLYYTPWQEPLNFNEASYEITAFDNCFFVMSIVGFLTIIFGIFCAYKLFGRDRRNGKMDIILSQNVSFSQVFAGKFTAIVFCTSFVLGVFTVASLLWAVIFYATLPGGILAVFNLSNAYSISPLLFLLIKIVGIELQVIFWATGTIFLMNISRKFDLTFALALLVFGISVVCNIFLNNFLVYCLFPFVHTDLTAFLGGGSINAGFLQTALYSNGNFFISLAYYAVVVVLLYNFTNQLFKKN